MHVLIAYIHVTKLVSLYLYIQRFGSHTPVNARGVSEFKLCRKREFLNQPGYIPSGTSIS